MSFITKKIKKIKKWGDTTRRKFVIYNQFLQLKMSFATTFQLPKKHLATKINCKW
jgi:hypothetical protein